MSQEFLYKYLNMYEYMKTVFNIKNRKSSKILLSTGHIPIHPSICTTRNLRAYFVNALAGPRWETRVTSNI